MFKNLNLKSAYRLAESFFSSHRLARIFLLIFLSFALAYPGVFLGSSEVMRTVDLLAEDSIYGKARFDDENIVVIAVSSDSSFNFYADGGNSRTLSKLVNALNSAPAGKPAVIGIAEGLTLDPQSDEYGEYLKLLEQDNVVLGGGYGSGATEAVGDQDMFVAPLTLRPSNDLSKYLSRGITVGHSYIVFDRDGVVRHYLWSGSTAYGNPVNSFALRCCQLWCQSTEIPLPEPKCSGDGLFMLSSFQGIDPERLVEVDSIMDSHFTGRDTAGRIVLIGASDSLISSEYVTSASSRYSVGNVGIQASAIATVLNDREVLECPSDVQLLVLWIIMAAIILALLSFSYMSSLLTGAAIITVYMFATVHLHSHLGIAVHPLYIIVGVCGCLLIGVFLRLSNINRAQMAETNILNRYMDTSVRNKILFRFNSGSQEIGAKRTLAILHADIKDFSSLVEDLSAEESIDILNSYFAVADKCIHANGGVLDTFSGSSVTAFWDDEECGGEATLKACRTALDISNGIRSVDDALFEKYRHEFSFSMGVHYGNTIIGDIGSENRKAFTVVGPVFETAKLLKDMATRGSVYISRTVHDKLGVRADDALLPDRIRHNDSLDYEQVFLLNDLFDPSEKYAPAPVSAQPAAVPEREYTLYILGTRGSYHVSGKRFVEFGGQTTCYILKTGTHAVIIDCGTGLYEAREILKDCTVVDVVISHVHYDHCIGLLDWSIFPPGAELSFYGNFRGWLGSRTLNEMFRPPFWPVDLVSGNMIQIPAWGKRLFLKDSISFVFFPAPHPNEAAIMSMNVGAKKVCIMVDCEQSNVLPMDILRDSDLLIYDGMYDDSEYKTHVGWGHSTWQEGIRLAQRASVKNLLISHHSPKNNDSVLLEYERLARGSFPNTTFARMGMTLKL